YAVARSLMSLGRTCWGLTPSFLSCARIASLAIRRASSQIAWTEIWRSSKSGFSGLRMGRLAATAPSCLNVLAIQRSPFVLVVRPTHCPRRAFAGPLAFIEDDCRNAERFPCFHQLTHV